MDAHDEKALVARCRSGDEEAFTALVEAHQSMVFGLLGRTIDDRAVVDDLAQEVFLRVHRALPHFRGDARFGTWLYRIVANVVSQHLAARRPFMVSIDPAPADEDVSPLDPGIADSHLDDLVRRDLVEKALRRLSPQYRFVIAAHYFEGVSYESLAEALGVPMGTVKTHLHRARRQLRHAIVALLEPRS